MQPLLFKTACSRGTQARMSIEYPSHVEDADGVTATWPGGRVPRAWLFDPAGGRHSTLDRCGHDHHDCYRTPRLAGDPEADLRRVLRAVPDL